MQRPIWTVTSPSKWISKTESWIFKTITRPVNSIEYYNQNDMQFLLPTIAATRFSNLANWLHLTLIRIADLEIWIWAVSLVMATSEMTGGIFRSPMTKHSRRAKPNCAHLNSWLGLIVCLISSGELLMGPICPHRGTTAELLLLRRYAISLLWGWNSIQAIM